MDARDDLRAAFADQQAQEDRRKQEREALALQQSAFESAEDEIRKRLYGVADLTVKALATIEPEKIMIMPKKPGLVGIFTAAQYALGWEFDFDGSNYVICPNGTLIRPGRYGEFSGSFAPEHRTLHDWIDGRLKRIRVDSGDSIQDYFKQAFVQGNVQSQQVLKSRLEHARELITRRLAELLREHGLSAI